MGSLSKLMIRLTRNHDQIIEKYLLGTYTPIYILENLQNEIIMEQVSRFLNTYKLGGLKGCPLPLVKLPFNIFHTLFFNTFHTLFSISLIK
ncbi:hypothetical protein ACE6H2_006329 [Prunus campanulata]